MNELVCIPKMIYPRQITMDQHSDFSWKCSILIVPIVSISCSQWRGWAEKKPHSDCDYLERYKTYKTPTILIYIHLWLTISLNNTFGGLYLPSDRQDQVLNAIIRLAYEHLSNRRSLHFWTGPAMPAGKYSNTYNLVADKKYVPSDKRRVMKSPINRKNSQLFIGFRSTRKRHSQSIH